MKKVKTASPLGLLLFLLSSISLYSQQTIASSGGNAYGSGGNVSYTIGQSDFIYQIGSNGSINQGVQQPYEFFTVGMDEHPNIGLACKVFPNPTVNYVTLLVEDINLEKLEIKLFDMSGKLLYQQSITDKETHINMDYLTTANYLLHVIQDQKQIKTFKIIKH